MVIIDVLVSIAIRTSQIFLINLELTVLLHTKYYLITVKGLFFVGINFRGLVKNYNFVDFVFVPKIKFVDFIFST